MTNIIYLRIEMHKKICSQLIGKQDAFIFNNKLICIHFLDTFALNVCVSHVTNNSEGSSTF